MIRWSYVVCYQCVIAFWLKMRIAVCLDTGHVDSIGNKIGMGDLGSSMMFMFLQTKSKDLALDTLNLLSTYVFSFGGSLGSGGLGGGLPTGDLKAASS